MMIATLAKLLREGVICTDGRRPVSAMFIDSAFGAPLVERLQGLGFEQVWEIRFGGNSPDPHYANFRSYMWSRMKDWLGLGSISKDDQKMMVDLCSPGAWLNRRDQLVLEPKSGEGSSAHPGSMAKRNVASPDDGDALALTFAQPVAPIGADSGYSAGQQKRNWLA